MVAPRRKKFLASRRRAHDDEGEDDAAPGAAVEDDSSSQQSLPSDVDDDADAEGSDASEIGTPNKNGFHAKEEGAAQPAENGAAAAKTAAFSPAVADTEAMLNGMKIADADASVDVLDFEDAGREAEQDAGQAAAVEPAAAAAAAAAANSRQESMAERRRREHEEYKRKRDADPAFVPNRGGFFMHDQRSAPTQNGFRPMGRGRGRGRGFAPFSPLGPPHEPSGPADSRWSHDLHETVARGGHGGGHANTEGPRHGFQNPQQGRPPVPPQSSAPPPNRSFSQTVQVGTIQLRVMMAGMKAPIFFSAVPVNKHTRLPHHRPPLRRDKPVRVSLPHNPPRYIFPAIERSFIFIPRALRPNQQGFHRGRGRGSFGYPSGRNSVYGGSVYSPSVAMSRRSSFARDIGREAMASPAGSVMSRNRSIIMDNNRPVVRLPPAADLAMMAQQMHPPPYMGVPMHAPIVNLPPHINAMHHPPPQPQDPLSQESLPVNLPMHQPRPQKAVSMAGIEAPGNLAVQAPPQQQQQPFHHQVPVTYSGGPPGQQPYPAESPAAQYAMQHARRPSYPSQHSTPLSQIPDRAIHAQPFQPYPYAPHPQAFYPQQYAPGPVYYYPTAPPQPMGPSMGAVPFVPGQQYPYMVPPPPPPPPQQQQGPNPNGESPGPGATVAHESNGMVYYYDPSQMAVPQSQPQPPPPSDEHGNAYQPMGYPPATGYMMPQPAVYYPSQ